MGTRLLMILSAAFLGVLGVLSTFLPQEILVRAGAQPEWIPVLLIQLLGALYLGIAILDWMARANLIGGIYGRPITLANFFNFSVGAAALLKGLVAHPFAPEVAVIAAIYTALGIWFGLVVFNHPGTPPRS